MDIAYNREDGGRLVRGAWISWAERQPDPKLSWLVPWEELPERDKEADRVIWDRLVAPYVSAITELNQYIDRLQYDIDQLHLESSFSELHNQE